MKRLLFILSAITIIAALLVLIIKSELWSRNRTSFSVQEDKPIDMITMVSGRESITLRRVDDRNWTVNGGSEARQSAVLFIIRTLRRIEIKSPVSDQFFDEHIKSQGIVPVEVSVYNSGRKLTSFLVYKFSDDPAGSVIRKSSASKPYIAHIPGYDINPGSHFITDPKFWSSYTIFSISPYEIESIIISDKGENSPDLEIRASGEGYKLSVSGEMVEDVDTTALMRYLAYYTYVPFEGWAYQLKQGEKDSIARSTPAFTISVEDKSGIKTELMLWRRFSTGRDDKSVDSDRLWGSINRGLDIFVVRYYDIDPLIKKGEYFISD